MILIKVFIRVLFLQHTWIKVMYFTLVERTDLFDQVMEKNGTLATLFDQLMFQERK